MVRLSRGVVASTTCVFATVHVIPFSHDLFTLHYHAFMSFRSVRPPAPSTPPFNKDVVGGGSLPHFPWSRQP